MMKSDSEEARKGSNISLKINYNIKTVGKNIGLKPSLKLHHFALKMSINFSFLNSENYIIYENMQHDI